MNFLQLSALRCWPLVLGVLLTACSPSELVQKVANPEKVKVAEDYIARLKTGDLEKLAEELDASIRTEKALENLRTMRAMIPKGPVTSTDLVGYHWQTVHAISGSESNYSVTHQFRHGDKWLLVLVAWKEKDGGPRRIIGFRVVPLTKSLQETHAFSLWDTDLVRALFLAGAIAIPIFSVTTLVVCIRTRIPKHKWLWIIFILVGIMKLSIDWTTGAIGFQPLAFQLFGASAFAQPFMAWVISISLPAGAIAFWIMRPKWRAAAIPPRPAEPPPLTTQS